MQVDLLVQMGPLVEVCTLVEQVSLVQEGISPQRAHPAVAQYGLNWRLADTVYSQTDGCACHDGCLHKPMHTSTLKPQSLCAVSTFDVTANSYCNKQVICLG